ncbi:hypothetical protein [Paenarthrobacter sp. NPDC089316]|uniref:hypothetical protein n=1 Tax=unclassified Paenarthrobacter TaxID=2634190 RepID=UPI00341E68F6
MKKSSSQTAGVIVNAVVSVANVTDVINGASVINVNLSYLFTWHNKSRAEDSKSQLLESLRQDMRVSAPTLIKLRLGEGRGGMATLIRE